MAEDEPLFIFTREQTREVDRLCKTEFGIPTIILMENAALGIASVAREVAARRDPVPPRVLVFCGPGNNGGDGLAAARHLFNDGSPVAIVLATSPEKLTGDARTNLLIAQHMGIPIAAAEPPAGSPGAAVEEARARCSAMGRPGNGRASADGLPDLVIDALLGTGLDRPPTGVMADLIGRINDLRAAGVPVLSVDVPSGLDADVGRPFLSAGGESGPAVRASVTVALLGLKPGYLTLAAQEFLGDCLVAPIGAPRALIRRLGRPMDAEAGSGDPDAL